jgi:uncharacterized membrane protein
MEWYNYLEAFFAGAFFANVVPHFVQGISGNKFPTPFAKPPGKGLSSPTTNVLWALANMVIGYLLFSAAPINKDNPALLVVFFVGIILLSLMGSMNFSKRDKE